ncbi:unnamed protein product [Closterium sp. NIES-53]
MESECRAALARTRPEAWDSADCNHLGEQPDTISVCQRVPAKNHGPHAATRARPRCAALARLQRHRCRHLLQFGTVTSIKRYEAWSTVSSSTGVLTGSSSLRADVTPVSQTLSFTFSVAGIAVGKTPSVSTSGFYTSDTRPHVIRAKHPDYPEIRMQF